MNDRQARLVVGDTSGPAPAAVELVDTVSVAAVDCVRRSAVVRRLADGTLPFAGRVAWLEQHWEGLRILRDCPLVPAAVRHDLVATTDRLSTALDRAHAGARWRDRHVTLPSMFAFRRHVTALKDAGDLTGLTAQVHLRLVCAGVGSGISGVDGPALPTTTALRDRLCALVTGEEDLERLSEEFSAGLLMVLQHGSDVCRTYRDTAPDETCAVTVATIRSALR